MVRPANRQTLEERLRHGGHKDNGFDTIRLIAAVLVLVSHSHPLVTGSNNTEALFVATGGQSTFGGLSVGVFFFISGLLIANSFDKSNSVLSFARKRALRIMPALVVVCLLLILIVGPAATNLSWPEYFAGAWSFMLNAIFLPHDFTLPGVFEQHPLRAVNGSLWSLKFEVACYIAAALVMLITQQGYRSWIACIAWAASFGLSRLLDTPGQSGLLFYLGTSASLYRFFGAGLLCYVFRHRIVLRVDAAWAALAATMVAILTPFFNEVAATFGCYAMLVFAYFGPTWFRKLTHRGDISYGTYVYAYPIQQLMVPFAAGSVLSNILLSLPLTLLAGLASWMLVEKPALTINRKAPRGHPAGEGPGFP